MLFNKIEDRQHTQLAYKVRCFPYHVLTPAARELINWHRLVKTLKCVVEDRLDDDLLFYCYEGRHYKIVWAWGNVPTELEWKKLADNAIIYLDLRSSPAIPEGQVAIFSLQLDSPQAAHLQFT